MKNWSLILYAALFIIFSSYIIYFLEPTFKTPFTGFWFVISTIAQQGFGDFLPKTLIGKIYTMILYVIGIGIFGIIIAKWVDVVMQYRQSKYTGKLSFYGKNHIILINYSRKTRCIIEEFITSKKNKIVLIDQLQSSPVIHEQVHYIQGSPTDKKVLHSANISDAKAICILSKENLNRELSIDGSTLLTASMIKKLFNDDNINTYTIVEVFNKEHLPSFKHLNIDQIILSNQPFTSKLSSYLML